MRLLLRMSIFMRKKYSFCLLVVEKTVPLPPLTIEQPNTQDYVYKHDYCQPSIVSHSDSCRGDSIKTVRKAACHAVMNIFVERAFLSYGEGSFNYRNRVKHLER